MLRSLKDLRAAGRATQVYNFRAGDELIEGGITAVNFTFRKVPCPCWGKTGGVGD